MKVRIRNGFSDRNKINEIPKEIQLTEFTPDTRTVLKNYCINLIDWCKESMGYDRYDFENYISDVIAEDIFCIPLDSPKARYNTIIKEFYDTFDTGSYDDLLSIIEYLANNLYVRDFKAEDNSFRYGEKIRMDLCKEFNKLFENEFVGYRFIEKIIVPISNEVEIKAISDAAETKYDKANEHIIKALKILSDRNNKDYKNVIKESLCALEGLCSLYSDKETLGKMIEDITNRLNIHDNLKNAIKNLYWFASDEPGIRHENKSKGNSVTFDEAKLVLVECSGIINYLVSIFEKVK